jgi:hypothetical protein
MTLKVGDIVTYWFSKVLIVAVNDDSIVLLEPNGNVITISLNSFIFHQG